jgi:hypothetical protein
VVIKWQSIGNLDSGKELSMTIAHMAAAAIPVLPFILFLYSGRIAAGPAGFTDRIN